MKALLLRIGIDKGAGRALAPIFQDGSFEYIPIPEGDPQSKENRTYRNTPARHDPQKRLSDYLPKKLEPKKMHFDLEFGTFTYGDPTRKRNSLVKLEPDDLLVFYAGLSPFENEQYEHRKNCDTRLYIIGYFTVEKVIGFKGLSRREIKKRCKPYPENAHSKRSRDTENLVIVVGRKSESRLLDKALPISQPIPDRSGKPCQAISSEMGALLGISGFIQRSSPRTIKNERNLNNLKRILGL